MKSIQQLVEDFHTQPELREKAVNLEASLNSLTRLTTEMKILGDAAEKAVPPLVAIVTQLEKGNE